MANPTLEGLYDELDSYERQLEDAEGRGETDRIRNLQERIRRVKIETDNLKTYNDVFNK